MKQNIFGLSDYFLNLNKIHKYFYLINHVIHLLWKVFGLSALLISSGRLFHTRHPEYNQV